MIDLDYGMGGLVSAKEGGTPEIRRTGGWRKAERQGRWTRSGVQKQSITTAAYHEEIGRDESGGTSKEPPLPLGRVW